MISPITISVILSFLMILYYVVFYRKYYFPNVKDKRVNDQRPEGLSASALRYIWQTDYDSDCLLADMVRASETDAYGIEWRDKSFLMKLRDPRKLNTLYEEERAALMFSARNPVQLLAIGQEGNQFTNRTEERLYRFLGKKYQHFLSPRKTYQWVGLLSVGFLFSLSLMIFGPFNITKGILYCVTSLGTLAAFQWFFNTLFLDRDWKYAGAIALLVGMAGALTLLIDVDVSRHTLYSLYFLPIIGVSIIGYIFMPRFTDEGVNIWQKIHGYRLYLKEKQSTDLYQDDGAVIADMLALGVPSLETKPFTHLLSAQEAGHASNNPNFALYWYSGYSDSW